MNVIVPRWSVHRIPFVVYASLKYQTGINCSNAILQVLLRNITNLSKIEQNRSMILNGP